MRRGLGNRIGGGIADNEGDQGCKKGNPRRVQKDREIKPFSGAAEIGEAISAPVNTAIDAAREKGCGEDDEARHDHEYREP